MIGALILIGIVIGMIIFVMGLIYVDDLLPLAFVGLVIAFGSIFCGAMYPVPDNYEERESMDVWYTDAPFGTYWVEVEGSGNFIHYKTSSDLRESYTIKYLSGSEVISLHFKTDEVRVFLTDDINNMSLVHITQYKYFLEDSYQYGEKWELYIPNPDLFEKEIE